MDKRANELWKKFMSRNGASVLLAMIAIFILMEIYLQITNPGHGVQFITFSNFFSILRAQTYVGIIAFGMTLVMITGNIDLSVGSMLTMMCSVVALVLMKTNSTIVTLIAALGFGALCGLFNGVLVSYLRLNSFITTLGASSIYSALALMVSAGTVLVINESPKAFDFLGLASLGPIHILIIWFVLVAVVLGWLLSSTTFGTNLYALGANPVAARFSGIRTKRVTTIAYVIVGLCVGLAAFITMANVKSANPQSAMGKEMDIILAVVLGGVAVTGGKGSVWGTIIGVLFTGTLSAALTQLNVTGYTQWIIMGIVMVFALSLDAVRQKGGRKL